MASVRYFVADVDRSLPFYEALGFKLSQRWGPPFAIVELDGLEVWMSGPGTSATKPMADGRVPEPGGWNRIVVESKDVLGLIETLRALGAGFRNEPITGPGGTQVVVDDPDGNPIELFQSRNS